MNRFDQFAPRAPPFSTTPAGNKRDEHGSTSGSDDGYYNEPKAEEQDDDAALTSQSLNADGTPKRPMNAFMIFARRRRPQVSAENQSMRTGEISKILSKEWTTMTTADKQFYLDQAKQLKETFNSKYPDYVYRRRPNNSRKKRKTDPLGRADDLVDDMASLGDFGETSPSDASDSQDVDLQFPRMHSPFESHTRMATYPFDRGFDHHRPLASTPRLTQNSYPSSYGYSAHGPAPYPPSSTTHWLDRPQKSYAPSPTSYSPSPTGTATAYPFPTLNTPFFPANTAYEPRPYSSRPDDNTYPRSPAGPRALPPLSNLTASASIPPIDAAFQWNRESRIDT